MQGTRLRRAETSCLCPRLRREVSLSSFPPGVATGLGEMMIPVSRGLSGLDGWRVDQLFGEFSMFPYREPQAKHLSEAHELEIHSP